MMKSRSKVKRICLLKQTLMKIKTRGLIRTQSWSISELFLALRTMVPFSKNSWPNGLEFLFDVESYDYALSSSGSEGLVLSIIYHLDIPIMKNIGINVQPGETGT